MTRDEENWKMLYQGVPRLLRTEAFYRMINSHLSLLRGCEVSKEESREWLNQVPNQSPPDPSQEPQP